jgi:hypothetical protein
MWGPVRIHARDQHRRPTDRGDAPMTRVSRAALLTFLQSL